MPGWGGSRRNDRCYIGDFNGDGRDDLYLFNGDDWSMPYLGMFRSSGNGFASVNRYDGDVPGWGGLGATTGFSPPTSLGTVASGCSRGTWRTGGRTTPGRMRSSGTALTADWREDWVGEWHLGSSDAFTVAIPEARRLVIDPEIIIRAGSGAATGRIPPGRVSGVATGLAGGTADTAASSAVDIIVRRRGISPGFWVLFEGPDRVIAHNRDWLGTIRTSVPLTLDSIYNRWVHDYRHGRNW